MVQRFSAELTLVHAYGAEALAYSDLPLASPELADDARFHEEKRLREFAHETFPAQHVETFVGLGEAGGVIHELVQRQGTDLVLLPTHGRGPVRRLLLGSVAAKVLHDVDAAVWTATTSVLMDHEPWIPYQSVLCAVDDSEEAEAVLKAAAAFACTYGASLSVVQAVEAPVATSEIDFTPYRRVIMDAADFRLRELKTRLGIHAPHTVLDTTVAESVHQEALQRKADVVITGRGHAQTGFNRLWSHLYQIVREAPCPVLSI